MLRRENLAVQSLVIGEQSNESPKINDFPSLFCCVNITQKPIYVEIAIKQVAVKTHLFFILIYKKEKTNNMLNFIIFSSSSCQFEHCLYRT